MDKNDKKIIELAQKRAMIYLPEDAVEIEIIATLYKNGTITKVTSMISNAKIQKAFQDANDNYIEDDDSFYITERGEDFYRELMEKGAIEL